MAEDNLQSLREAVARNCGLVLSLPNAMGLLHHHKSRFVAEDADGLWIESVAGDRELVDQLITSGKDAGVSFKAGVIKVVFAAPILRRDANYRVNGSLTSEAILLRRPTNLQLIQRRANYRAKIHADIEMSLRVWRIGRSAYLKDRPPAAQELAVKMRDISTGGVGVTFMAKDNDPPRVTPEDRLRLQLTIPGGEALLIEGRLRYPVKLAKDATEVPAGIQFKQLNDDIEERQVIATLTRVVGEMQREEARRFRLGIA